MSELKYGSSIIGNSIYDVTAGPRGIIITTDRRIPSDLLEIASMRPQCITDMLRQNLTGTRPTLPTIEKVIFNDPATIVYWADGTKTIVKSHDELFDPEKGLAMAISKKALGNQGNYFEVFKKHIKHDGNIATSFIETMQRLAHAIGRPMPIQEESDQPSLFDIDQSDKLTVGQIWATQTQDTIDRINYLLDKKGMTRAKLAKELGVSSSTVSRYLNGKTDMNILMLSRISVILGTDIDWLFTGKTRDLSFNDQFISA